MDKSKKVKVIKIILLFFLLSFIVGGIIFYLLQIRKYNNLLEEVKNEVIVEYGTALKLEDIVNNTQHGNVNITPNLESLVDVGTYDVKVSIDENSFTTKVIIQDTTAPVLEVQNVTRYIDEGSPNVVDFVLSVNDLSAYELVPLTINPVVGEQSVTIIARDIYGNETKKEALLTILEDKSPPVFTGLFNLSIEAGDAVSLTSGVQAIDERFGKVSFSYDDSKVNYNVPGNYTIFYNATDGVGNVAKATRKIEILEKIPTYMINNFPTFNQYPNYPNGCEIAALYNLLRYYHVNVSIENLADELLKGDGPYWDGNILYGGNPEIHFVGDPRDIHGYGVFQKPIIALANQYKSGIIDYTGHSLDDVLLLVQKKIPVQVWVSINLKNTKVCTHWTYKETGEKISWICDLHSVVIIGYNRYSVFVSDSYTGKIEEYNRSQFEKMYNLFGKRAIYYPN